MVRFILVVALATALATATSSKTHIDPAIFDPVPDPSCSRGLRNGDACCPAECGKCGGRGCKKRSGGAACCRNAVIALERSCKEVGPPCDKSLMVSVTTTPPTSSTDTKTTGTTMPTVTTMTSTESTVTTATSATSTALVSTTSTMVPVTTTMAPITTTIPPSTTAIGIDIWKNITSKSTGSFIPRSGACFVMVRGKAYLLGGRGLPATNIFNPTTRTWTEGAAPLFEFHHAQCVVFKNKVFVPASYSGEFPNEKANARMLVYDTRNDRWRTRAGMPAERRRGAAASVLFDMKLWVVGGSQFGHGAGSKTVGFMDFYDLVTKKWVTELPNLPIKRDHFGAGIVNGKLCVAGGRDSSKEEFFRAVVRSTWCYDFSAMEWKNVRAPLPGARAGAAYGKTCDGKLIVAGGEGMRMRPFTRVDLFDGERWTSSAKLARGRHSTGIAIARCAKCSQIFIAAGNGKRGEANQLDSIEVFLPGGVDEVCEKY